MMAPILQYAAVVMIEEKSLRTLLIEPDAGCREIFRLVAVGSQVASRVVCAPDFTSAFRNFESGEQFDFIFVSSAFPEGQIRDFFKASRKQTDKNVAYVVVAHGQARETWRVASSLINGVDGFLFYPFSVQSFINSVTGARKIQDDERMEREKTAIALLARSITEQLTDAATLRASGNSAKLTIRMLAEMCSVLKELEPWQLDYYYQALSAYTETASPAIRKSAPVAVAAKTAVSPFEERRKKYG